ncbi:SdpI family protein [Flavobacterium sp.]|uniref:SdpI family protein n=1 Tax=Flavobacterium sp. TaxID=239 RepID=UPI00286D85D1|nr:SdpI family protein [Flavobacterium sp.]
MNKTLKNELPIIGFVLLPFIYLAYLWNSLPEKVPIHWNYKGEIDNRGTKYALIGILFLLPVLTYVLMLVIPKIDPKKRVELMGGKYYHIKFVLVVFMSVLALFIIHSSNSQTLSSPSIVFVLLGALFMALGNYFKVIKQNYFLGIKTPWTLESEEVWKLTHILAGKLWIIGGLLIVIFSLVLPQDVNFYFFIVITAIISIVPIVYSYIVFKELKKLKQ